MFKCHYVPLVNSSWVFEMYPHSSPSVPWNRKFPIILSRPDRGRSSVKTVMCHWSVRGKKIPNETYLHFVHSSGTAVYFSSPFSPSFFPLLFVVYDYKDIWDPASIFCRLRRKYFYSSGTGSGYFPCIFSDFFHWYKDGLNIIALLWIMTHGSHN